MHDYFDARIVCWNCAGIFHKNATALSSFDFDLAIISEAPADFALFLDNCTSQNWVGDIGKRGVGIAARNGWVLEQSPYSFDERYFLSCVATRGDNQLLVVGVCVRRAGDYVTPTLAVLDRIAAARPNLPWILAGDFNQSVAFDRKRSPARHFQRVVERMDALGMRSAWHDHYCEKFGEETVATFYQHWRDEPKDRFHIDYAFISDDINIRNLEIGTFSDFTAKKLSDHSPLVLDIRA